MWSRMARMVPYVPSLRTSVLRAECGSPRGVMDRCNGWTIIPHKFVTQKSIQVKRGATLPHLSYLPYGVSTHVRRSTRATPHDPTPNAYLPPGDAVPLEHWTLLTVSAQPIWLAPPNAWTAHACIQAFRLKARTHYHGLALPFLVVNLGCGIDIFVDGPEMCILKRPVRFESVGCRRHD